MFEMQLIIEILFYTFIVAVSIQFFYQFIVFMPLSLSKIKKENSQEIPVSVVITTKNQLDDLKTNLPKYLQQEYSVFEVVVVNDASWDGTDAYLEMMEAKHSNLKVVSNKFQDNDRFSKGMKFALTLGVKSASYDCLLFSDADSYPNSPKWIQNMQSSFSTKKHLVLASSRLEKGKGLINRLRRFESISEALLGLSFAKMGKAIYADKRNIAFQRDLFFSVNGFFSHLDTSHGQAELFVNEASKNSNVTICLNPEAVTIRGGKSTLADWFREKRAYYSIADRMKFSTKLILGLQSCSLLLFWAIFIPLIILDIHLELILALVALRFLLQYIVYWGMAKKVAEKHLFWAFPFFELCLLIILPIIYLSTSIKKVSKWD